MKKPIYNTKKTNEIVGYIELPIINGQVNIDFINQYEWVELFYFDDDDLSLNQFLKINNVFEHIKHEQELYYPESNIGGYAYGIGINNIFSL